MPTFSVISTKWSGAVWPLLAQGRAGLGEDAEEIAEVRVFQNAGEFARGPIFHARRVDAFDAFKCVAGGGGRGFAHMASILFLPVQKSKFNRALRFVNVPFTLCRG